MRISSVLTGATAQLAMQEEQDGKFCFLFFLIVHYRIEWPVISPGPRLTSGPAPTQDTAQLGPDIIQTLPSGPFIYSTDSITKYAFSNASYAGKRLLCPPPRSCARLQLRR